MADVGFVPVRGNANEIANTPLEDGQFLYTTEAGTANNIYADVLRDDGTTERISILGNYVSKSGDTITGSLRVDGSIDLGGTVTFKSTVGQVVSLKDIFKYVYPVGSVYISTDSTNPANYFGGAWVELNSNSIPHYIMWKRTR